VLKIGKEKKNTLFIVPEENKTKIKLSINELQRAAGQHTTDSPERDEVKQLRLNSWGESAPTEQNQSPVLQ